MNKIPIGLKRAATLRILRSQGKFLLLKRAKEPNKDRFTPVGGKLEPFENPLKAAIRETLEETGIKVNTMRFCGILTETSPTRYNWINFVYTAEIDFVEPPICDEGTLMWVSFDQLSEVPTPKTDWYIYRYILDGKPFMLDALYDGQLNLLSMSEEIENRKII